MKLTIVLFVSFLCISAPIAFK